jgi:hypothetical protein
VYQWRCERCGAVLREVGRERYRPLFRADGTDALAERRALPG